MNKKGKLTTNLIGYGIVAILVIVILFKLLAVLVPEAMTSGDELTTNPCELAGGYWNLTDTSCDVSASNTTAVSYGEIPLASLFSGSGVIFIIVMVSFLLIVVYGFLSKKK